MPIIIEKLNYTYLPGTPFEHKALTDIDLTIGDGELVGLIGCTGSGKSTLMQIMAGLLKPDSGCIKVDGVDIFAKGCDKKWLHRTVGVVFQYPEYQLFEETVAKDIAYGPKMTGVPAEEIPSRVKEAMELVGVSYDEFAECSPFELSGGEKRKVALAGVLAMRPRIMLMDEPIAGLDPQGRDSFMQLVKKLNDTGVTVIMISHNMDGLAEYAKSIVMLREGRVIMRGTPEEIFSEHEKMAEEGMGLPEVSTLVKLLNERGFDVPRGLIRFDELKEYLIKRMRSGL